MLILVMDIFNEDRRDSPFDMFTDDLFADLPPVDDNQEQEKEDEKNEEEK